MWARTVEIMLACWLAISPFVFQHAPDATFLWVNDFAVAAVIMVISFLAMRQNAERVRLLNLATSAYLIAVAYIPPSPPPPPAYQNYMVVGLLLLIVAVIPTRAAVPPRGWLAFYEDRKGLDRG